MTRRPIPRLHKLLVNMGLSAAGAAAIIHVYRHDRNALAFEVVRAAWQNRAVFRQPLPGSAKYR